MSANANKATPASLAGNIGWTLWNYSVRLSAPIHAARAARDELDSRRATGRCRASDLVELESLAQRLEEYATRARATWDLLRAAQRASDDDLVDDEGAVAVIRGGGVRPELRKRLAAIYRTGDVRGYEEDYAQFQRLMTRSLR